MDLVSYDIATGRVVYGNMTRRNADMHSWIAQLEAESKKTMADWDGQAVTDYAAAKAKWDLAEDEAHIAFETKIKSWGLMLDAMEDADLQGAAGFSY